MKYIGQCLVIFLDHTNMPDFQLSSLDSNTTHKKSPKMCVLFFEKKKNLQKQNSFRFF